MFPNLGGWARLGIVLCVAWSIGVSTFALVNWIQLAYFGHLTSPPFAHWEDPAAAPRSPPERIVREWGQAFEPRWAAAGDVPRFSGSVYVTALLGPPLLVLVTVLAARWVLAGFRNGPRLDESALRPFRPGADDPPPATSCPQAFSNAPPARLAR